MRSQQAIAAPDWSGSGVKCVYTLQKQCVHTNEIRRWKGIRIMKYRAEKIGIIGLGHVGPHVANSLILQGIADEILLCDIN